MKKIESLDKLPDTKKVVVVLSGGMDSTIAMRLCVEKYGAENVSALTFDYGQKQRIEIERAAASTSALGVQHKVIDAKFLYDISLGFSANVDVEIDMPTIQEVLGDPRPKTYVPNRNMILMSITAAYAETVGAEYIVTGLQVTDEYGYWDTTRRFVDKMEAALAENRNIKVKIIAPFIAMSKTDELDALLTLDGNVEFLKHTMTCYNPAGEKACGKCPSCAERIKAFMNMSLADPIEYIIDIPW